MRTGGISFKNINITIAQLKSKLGDKQHNLDLIASGIKKASAEFSDIIVFPELFLTGYSVGDNLKNLAETINGPSINKIKELCVTYNMYTIVGFPEDGGDGKYYISSALIDNNGEILGVYRKAHLFHNEKDYFTTGSKFEVINTPLGNIGLMICYDVEFPEISRALKLMGADIIIIINANMHPYKEYHNLYARCRAMENEIPVVICNRVGIENALEFCGDSMAISATGEVLLALHEQEVMTSVTVPIKEELDPKIQYTVNRRSDMYDILSRTASHIL